MTQFGLSQIQAQAILDMQLQRLTGLERQKILDELAELLKTIERLRAILASERLLMQIIVDELKAVRDKYGDDRRTEIIEGESGELSIEDLIAEEDMAITVSNTGYIKRTAISDLPQPAARRQGPHRHAHARRGLRQPPVRRLDARLHHDLLGPRPRLLAEGPRDSRRRPGRQGQVDRQPGVDGRGREDRGDAGGEGVRGGQVHRHGHAARASSRRRRCRRSATRAPAASSRWASKRATR